MRPVDATTLKAWISQLSELAILDAREEGEFGHGHMFWAVPCPLSKKELRARALLPRLATRVVCVDGGEGHAAKLAAYLTSIGYADVHVLQGGTPARRRLSAPMMLRVRPAQLITMVVSALGTRSPMR